MTVEKAKITKQIHSSKNYARTYNVEILNSSNPEVQLKNAKPAIKSKPKNSLNEIKEFKFVVALVLK